jgi:hypothetical protein
MTNPTKPASGGPKKSNTGKVVVSGSTAGTAVARTAANRAQSKKIMNKRQTPWGLIIATVVIVALAIGVIGYAVSQNKKKDDSANPDKISGIVHKSFPSGEHKTTVITYAESPPMGGPHSPIWADCDGTVYPNQIANENAVHDLEHGAVWITYKPGLPSDQLDVLSKLVAGKPYTLMTPYAGLKSNVSLQAWGYQLFVDSATDSRVQQFIKVLRQSQTNTPELGASCTNSAFKTNPSTPGHPTES